MTLTIGSLFSGIGLPERGLFAAGMGPTLWQCEIDPWCREVLAKHWPDATRYTDVRDCSPRHVDIIMGGFPCVDVSSASHSKAKGLAGKQSGLWSEFRRVIAYTDPRWVIVENIYNQWRRWVPIVRRDLYDLGYASVPIRVCASDVGAPHSRPRVFVVANADPEGKPLRSLHAEVARLCADARRSRSAWRDPFTGPVRLADGHRSGMAGVRALGNAALPQIFEVLGRAILAAETP